MKIMIMKPEHYKDAMDLWYGAKGVGHSPDDTEENIKLYLKRNPKTSFVVFDGGKMVAAIMAGHDGYRGYIHHTAVLEAYRGKGVGKMLVKNALDAIRADGVNKVALVAFDTNKQGNLFWEKQGFTVREDLIYRNLRING